MARRKGPRRPNEDELALWRRVARTANPIGTKNAGQMFEHASTTAAPETSGDPAPSPIKPFRLGERAAPSAPQTRLPGSDAPRMDGKAFRKLTRGKMVPEARIDLHGMTQDQAHLALEGFVLRSWNADRRLVLVITGKGRERVDDGPIPARRGILKAQVPRWLRQGQMGLAVLDVTPAHRRHGGDGAFYVYLRRRR